MKCVTHIAKFGVLAIAALSAAPFAAGQSPAPDRFSPAPADNQTVREPASRRSTPEVSTELRGAYILGPGDEITARLAHGEIQAAVTKRPQ